MWAPRQVLLANIAAAPNRSIAELDIMGAEERQAVLRSTISGPQLSLDGAAFRRQTIHGMLEHWAAATPDAPAAAFMVRAVPCTSCRECGRTRKQTGHA